MCLVALAVGVVYIVLFWLARKEHPEKTVSRLLKPFYCIALYLYKQACMKGIPIAGRRQVSGDLERLHPNENREAVCTDYYVGKLAKSLFICFLGTALGIIVSAKGSSEKLLLEDGTILRGDYTEGSRSVELEARLETGEKQRFSVQVEAIVLSREEAEQLAGELVSRLPTLILGKNISLQEVTDNLLLEEYYEDYPFWVEWHSSQPELVTDIGEVTAAFGKTAQVVLTARIIYEKIEGLEWKQEIPICVPPPVLTEEEELWKEMEGLLASSEQNGRNLSVWRLPERLRGKQIVWKQRMPDYGFMLCVASLMTAVVIFFLADKDMHDELELKRLCMKRSYPDVIQKLVLYMGAGLTVRGAFRRIADGYEQERREGKPAVPIYEEILWACRQLHTGVSEGAVYERFGKRTGLQEYIRLSSLLTQNLKKGNSTLLQRLREEADRACMEQLQNSRRLGEEAATKLLLPMVMMLVVVMLIIMIPAFSSVGV